MIRKINYTEFDVRLNQCWKELRRIKIYQEAVAVLIRHDLRLGEYGSYGRDDYGCAFYNESGSHYEFDPIGIQIIHTWKKDKEEDHYVADKILILTVYYTSYYDVMYPVNK